ncbi:hypothetical protein E3N88_04632 [Mikania micrantha]|uniref:Uncharacterized protein n=1 Tax=Mikania micrantha TaxID=192012 RepID=A0A5N6PV00_9ASTR|nr:hypothetical protein E3N88_04632 [Mikania micrantha]
MQFRLKLGLQFTTNQGQVNLSALLNKYIEAANNGFTIGMRFKMRFESEDSPERRFTGTIVGVEDISPHWEDSKWRSLKVQWDEPTSIMRPERVSPWEIEPFADTSIEIPDDLNTMDPLATLIQFVYPSILQQFKNPEYFRERSILAPKNEFVQEINDQLFSLFPGDEVEYLSSDSICQTEQLNESVNENLYSPDVLNGLNLAAAEVEFVGTDADPTGSLMLPEELLFPAIQSVTPKGRHGFYDSNLESNDWGAVVQSWLNVFATSYPFLEELRLKSMSVTHESLKFIGLNFDGL